MRPLVSFTFVISLTLFGRCYAANKLWWNGEGTGQAGTGGNLGLESSSKEGGSEQCRTNVGKWLSIQKGLESPVNLHQSDVTYFLHVPRTGGRSYHQCFLRNAFPKSLHCPPSYDIKDFEAHEHLPIFKRCKLLASHEDYSTVPPLQQLGRVPAVISQLRDPVDRVLSAYEFSIEVALRDAMKKPSERFKQAPRELGKPGKVKTFNVFPWDKLVPLMMQDILNRWAQGGWERTHPLPSGFSESLRNDPEEMYVHSTYAGAWTSSNKVKVDPYNNSYLMPLHEFIEHPEVRRVIHNGAAMQFVGLSHSTDPLAVNVMNCAQKSRVEAEATMSTIADLAKQRLDNMAFVSITERINDAARLLSHLKHWKMNSPQSWSEADAQVERQGAGDETRFDPDFDPAKELYEPEDTADHHNPGGGGTQVDSDTDKYNPVGRKLAEEQRSRNSEDQKPRRDDHAPLAKKMNKCLEKARNKYNAGRKNTFANAKLPFKLSSESRQQISPTTINNIRAYNQIDLQLFMLAKERFEKLFDEHSQDPEFPPPIAESYKISDKETDLLSRAEDKMWQNVKDGAELIQGIGQDMQDRREVRPRQRKRFREVPPNKGGVGAEQGPWDERGRGGEDGGRNRYSEDGDYSNTPRESGRYSGVGKEFRVYMDRNGYGNRVSGDDSMYKRAELERTFEERKRFQKMDEVDQMMERRQQRMRDREIPDDDDGKTMRAWADKFNQKPGLRDRPANINRPSHIDRSSEMERLKANSQALLKRPGNSGSNRLGALDDERPYEKYMRMQREKDMLHSPPRPDWIDNLDGEGREDHSALEQFEESRVKPSLFDPPERPPSDLVGREEAWRSQEDIAARFQHLNQDYQELLARQREERNRMRKRAAELHGMQVEKELLDELGEMGIRTPRKQKTHQHPSMQDLIHNKDHVHLEATDDL